MINYFYDIIIFTIIFCLLFVSVFEYMVSISTEKIYKSYAFGVIIFISLIFYICILINIISIIDNIFEIYMVLLSFILIICFIIYINYKRMFILVDVNEKQHYAYNITLMKKSVILLCVLFIIGSLVYVILDYLNVNLFYLNLPAYFIPVFGFGLLIVVKKKNKSVPYYKFCKNNPEDKRCK